MRLARDSVEYAQWTITGLPEGAVPAPEVYLAGKWHPMEWAEATDTGWIVRVLVAGPDVQTGTAVALPLGRTVPRIRLTDAPEAIVRDSTAAIEVE